MTNLPNHNNSQQHIPDHGDLPPTEARPPAPQSGGSIFTPLALLAVIGLPATMIIVLAITQNLGQALLLGLLYVIVTATVGFLRRVWEHLSSEFAEDLAGRLSAQIRLLFSRYDRRYRDYLIATHRFVDLKGLSNTDAFNLELEKVFVQLSVAPESAENISTGLILPATLKQGSRTIWDYLKSGQNLAILGGPGTGKTTLLRQAALSLTHKHRRRIKHIPILLFLRDHGAAIDADETFSLVQAVQASLNKYGGKTPPQGWFEQHVDRGDCLVMLDGLDEVAAPELRKKVMAWVDKQIVAHNKNQFILTSRPLGYRDNPSGQVNVVLKVDNFTYDQIHTFVHNWYLLEEIRRSGKDDLGVHDEARRGAVDLLRRLGDKRELIELAVNPLLLTMITIVHRHRNALHCPVVDWPSIAISSTFS